jgi:SAM-dependent methyltransferase
MRPEEAAEIARWVRDLELPPGAVCLNIGSSTKWFRTEKQPHIDRLLFGPLEKAGLRVVHCDMKTQEGVDEVGDVLDPAVQERLRSYNADLLICSNLLEHLTDPQSFARACGSLVKPGGYGLFTVPYKYPYHADPIDTMLRPSPDELARFLSGWQVIKAVDKPVGSYRAELAANPSPLLTLAKHIGRVLLPFYRPAHWMPLVQRLTYLFRPYRQSMLLARKPVAMS